MLIVLDRDGVINEDSDEYIKTPDEWIPINGSLEAIARLNQVGHQVVVVSNQSGIARGYYDDEMLAKIHEKMTEMLSAVGGHLDGIFYCPHHPDENCKCRKPKTGLLEKAILNHNIDVSISFLIGDRMLDIEAGNKIGLKTVIIPEKIDMVDEEMLKTEARPDYYSTNFIDGVNWILDNTK